MVPGVGGPLRDGPASAIVAPYLLAEEESEPEPTPLESGAIPGEGGDEGD
jgi:hypothetical protein